ncbi:hypothetical protein FIV42_25530 [Persicimonas caeni]|uniref:Lipoprotein n=1 Tax=Persicimonas caeni TaxID=2292766 RepID=A0A4Y6Q076_PERCE|nr:hypothetical protein [Persicimonas caeni]QDG53981.1 hypothetical protein FIV42_25530 [Persicimonas caeni]QED35202.1 hypothetical protein FRD00_25525 [Persicimonas caeni]
MSRRRHFIRAITPLTLAALFATAGCGDSGQAEGARPESGTAASFCELVSTQPRTYGGCISGSVHLQHRGYWCHDYQTVTCNAETYPGGVEFTPTEQIVSRVDEEGRCWSMSGMWPARWTPPEAGDVCYTSISCEDLCRQLAAQDGRQGESQ